MALIVNCFMFVCCVCSAAAMAFLIYKLIFSLMDGVKDRKRKKTLENAAKVCCKVVVDEKQYQLFKAGLQPYISMDHYVPYREGNYLYLMETNESGYIGGGILATVKAVAYDQTFCVILFLSRVDSLPTDLGFAPIS